LNRPKKGPRCAVWAFLALVALSSFTAEQAHAQISDGLIKVGVLNDESGPYAAVAGSGSRVAALMAVEDFDTAGQGMKVEIVFADHQNKVDVGAKIARQWYDAEKVDVIVDVPTSSESSGGKPSSSPGEGLARGGQPSSAGPFTSLTPCPIPNMS
jgi:ABC-type branched-subunit amino acid transport system substrate-binding protein